MALGIDEALVRRAREVMGLLSRRELSIVTAESCTAGLLAAILAQGEGASTWLHGGTVAYTKAQKSIALGVSSDLLAAKGSVNGDVAKAMAEGALLGSQASLALALTGVLGPDEDEDGNPVGLVVFASARRGQAPAVVERRFPPGDPDRLRNAVVAAALDLIEAAAMEPSD